VPGNLLLSKLECGRFRYLIFTMPMYLFYNCGGHLTYHIQAYWTHQSSSSNGGRFLERVEVTPSINLCFYWGQCRAWPVPSTLPDYPTKSGVNSRNCLYATKKPESKRTHRAVSLFVQCCRPPTAGTWNYFSIFGICDPQQRRGIFST
jgi:hypothetical protein